jgi:hypothetical protein
VIDKCESILLKHTNVDRQLMPLLNQKFANQINNSKIDSTDVKLRNIVHNKPLFDLRWFDNNGNPRTDEVLSLMAQSLFKRCHQSGELSDRLFDLVASSYILNNETSEALKKIKIDNYSHLI